MSVAKSGRICDTPRGDTVGGLLKQDHDATRMVYSRQLRLVTVHYIGDSSNLWCVMGLNWAKRDKRKHDNDEAVTLNEAMDRMAQSKWVPAARALRKILANRDEGHIWVQYGHALKEAGFFSAALDAYNRAAASSAEDFDIRVQIGHLHKICGNFEAAGKAYEAASALCGNEKIRQEIAGFLDQLASFRPQAAQKRSRSASVIISCITKSGQESEVAKRSPLGRQNYSYGFAMRGFQRAMDSLSIPWMSINAPHYISDLKQITAAERPVHLAFYPPHDARLLKGAKNILVFAWEFPILPSRPPHAHAFSDPSRVLDLFDEIWVPSSEAVEIVQKHTKKPVKFVPSPVIANEQAEDGAVAGTRADAADQLKHIQWVPLTVFPRLQPNFNNHAMARQRRTPALFSRSSREDVYLCVVNPHDRRKQLKPLIDGFLEFASKNKNALLLMKTASPDDDNHTINRRLLTHQLAQDELLLPPYVSDRVWITNTSLTNEEMDHLYKLSDFYVCTSYAEGQNLPLLEAMMQGLVPVSVRHTAMSDYISEKNAIVIEHTVTRASALLEDTYRIWGADTNVVQAGSVHKALGAAARLSESQRAKMAAESRRTLDRLYSAAALEEQLNGIGVSADVLAGMQA
jgi:glycosyltransferase involved in cell wall biosynthesis